jgi:hypothetical protein
MGAPGSSGQQRNRKSLFRNFKLLSGEIPAWLHAVRLASFFYPGAARSGSFTTNQSGL